VLQAKYRLVFSVIFRNAGEQARAQKLIFGALKSIYRTLWRFLLLPNEYRMIRLTGWNDPDCIRLSGTFGRSAETRVTSGAILNIHISR